MDYAAFYYRPYLFVPDISHCYPTPVSLGLCQHNYKAVPHFRTWKNHLSQLSRTTLSFALCPVWRSIRSIAPVDPLLPMIVSSIRLPILLYPAVSCYLSRNDESICKELGMETEQLRQTKSVGSPL